MKNRTSLITTLTCLALAVFSPPGALAQGPVADGLAWLKSDQNPSGSWGSTFEFVDTATAVETLALLDPDSAELDAGVDWLAGQTASNLQHLARELSAIAGTPGGGTLAAALAAELLAARNPAEFDTGVPNWPEGGWGVAVGFESDCMTTALSLLGLEVAGLAGGISVEDEALDAGGSNLHEWDIASDAAKARILITVVGSTVRLRMKQGSPPNNFDPYFQLPPGTYLIVFPDNGLPFTPGHNFIRLSSTGPAASYSFAASYNTPTLDTRAFAEALDYLQESQNLDGGWGVQRGQATELFTTLHVLLALQAFPGYDLDAERSAGIAYLLGEQLAGGGFGFDGVDPVSYVTALAALDLIGSESYPFGTATNDAIAALLGLQDVDGSWDALPFHTANALRALWEHNQPPTADAGPDQVVSDADSNGSEQVALSGSGADVDGVVVGYTWTEDGAEIATGQTPTVTLGLGAHDIVLTVEDDGLRTGEDTVLVTVTSPPCSPVTGLACQSVGTDVELNWDSDPSYVSFDIFRDAVFLGSTSFSTFTDPLVPTGTYTYTVQAVCTGEVLAPGVDCVVDHSQPCAPVESLSCASNELDVDLAWSNLDAYASINVYRNATLIATVAGVDTTFTELDVPTGSHVYTIEAVCTDGVPAPGESCAVDHVNLCSRVTYCTSKLSSALCTPSIGSTGTPSLTGDDDFFVNATEIQGQTTGVLLWSLLPNPPATGPGTLMWGLSRQGVRLCVLGAPRIVMSNSGGTSGACDGTFSFHFSQALMSSEGLLAGTDVYAQFIFDDPGHMDGTGLGHTNALRFTICQ